MSRIDRLAGCSLLSPFFLVTIATSSPYAATLLPINFKPDSHMLKAMNHINNRSPYIPTPSKYSANHTVIHTEATKSEWTTIFSHG